MTMLRELMPLKATFIEAEGGLRPGVLSKIGGIFQRANTKNANGRVYPLPLWQKILTDPDVKERVENRKMVGMIGHPESGQTDAEKIALVITKQELRGDNSIYGEAEILDTPVGRIADTLLRAGIGLGISSRGDGSVEKKGESQEVQNDFKLETYDLVLKPSTPGAYPEMLSESVSVEEHEKLVAEAIGGLVNSEMAADQRLPILSECLKILNVLEAKNSGKLVATLSTKITETLSDLANERRVITSIEANESVDSNSEFQTQLEDDSMNEKKNPPAGISESTLDWHRSAVNEAVRSVQVEGKKAYDKVTEALVNAQREHTETKQSLRSAEQLIEEMQAEIRSLKESRPSDQKLERRYAATVELLDEALKKLPMIGQLTRRNQTLEGLVSAGLKHISEEKKARKVNECLRRVDPKQHDLVRPMLESCRTPEQVAATFKRLVALSGGGQVSETSRREPLPSGGGQRRQMTETKKEEKSTKKVTESRQGNPMANFASLVGNRLSKAV